MRKKPNCYKVSTGRRGDLLVALVHLSVLELPLDSKEKVRVPGDSLRSYTNRIFKMISVFNSSTHILVLFWLHVVFSLWAMTLDCAPHKDKNKIFTSLFKTLFIIFIYQSIVHSQTKQFSKTSVGGLVDVWTSTGKKEASRERGETKARS